MRREGSNISRCKPFCGVQLLKQGLHLEIFDPSRRMIEPSKAGSTLVYNLTLIFESFVKYFHEEIPVATLFFLFFSLSLGADYEEMEMNSGKPKEVFVHNRLIHKNLSQVCNSCYRLRDSNSSLWPIFV